MVLTWTAFCLPLLSVSSIQTPKDKVAQLSGKITRIKIFQFCYKRNEALRVFSLKSFGIGRFVLLLAIKYNRTHIILFSMVKLGPSSFILNVFILLVASVDTRLSYIITWIYSWTWSYLITWIYSFGVKWDCCLLLLLLSGIFSISLIANFCFRMGHGSIHWGTWFPAVIIFYCKEKNLLNWF